MCYRIRPSQTDLRRRPTSCNQMATTILFMLFATLLLRATLSFPLSQDVKSVQLSDNVGDVDHTKKTVVFDPDTIRSEDTDQVKSLDIVTFDRGFGANSVKRTKRQVIDGHHNCPQGMIWYWNICITREKYEQLKEGDDYDES